MVADDVSLRAQTRKHLLWTQNVSGYNKCCVSDTNVVSATNAARARVGIKLGNILCPQQCFPRLPPPLHVIVLSSDRACFNVANYQYTDVSLKRQNL